MQTLHEDASDKFRSLDNDYYFGGQLEPIVTALEDDPGNGESGMIYIKVGS